MKSDMRSKDEFSSSNSVLVFGSNGDDIISYCRVNLVKKVCSSIIIQRNINSVVRHGVFSYELTDAAHSHAGFSSGSFAFKNYSISLSQSIR